MQLLGLPSPRVVIGGLPLRQDVRQAEMFRLLAAGWSGRLPQHDALRTSPVLTMRHNARSSLRARATIIVVLRAPLAPSVRLRNHSASALSFWNLRKRQASWIRPRRTRALPDLASPFSRRLEPLSSGEPVSPA